MTWSPKLLAEPRNIFLAQPGPGSEPPRRQRLRQAVARRYS